MPALLFPFHATRCRSQYLCYDTGCVFSTRKYFLSVWCILSIMCRVHSLCAWLPHGKWIIISGSAFWQKAFKCLCTVNKENDAVLYCCSIATLHRNILMHWEVYVCNFTCEHCVVYFLWELHIWFGELFKENCVCNLCNVHYAYLWLRIKENPEVPSWHSHYS